MFRVVSKHAVHIFFFRSRNVIFFFSGPEMFFFFFSGLEMFRVVSEYAVNFFQVEKC